MKTLLRVVGLALALPVCLVVGLFAGNWLNRPTYEPVDPADLPFDLAVLGAWHDDDGRFVCRAFYLRDLQPNADAIPGLRHRVSDTELEQCVAAFRAYSGGGEWPQTFSWERSSRFARVVRDERDPDVYEVSYVSDIDRVADTRYRVDEATGQPVDLEFRGAFGPGRGFGALVLGVPIGAALWLLLVGVVIYRALTERRRRPALGASPAEGR